MSGKSFFQFFLGGILGWLLLATPIAAAPPWENWDLFKKVEADPDKDYTLGAGNGPWLIMASSFSGEGAASQARNLALELRQRYKLPAYVHEVQFNLKDVRGRGVNRYGAPPKMRYRQGSEIKEIAVMVGDFPSVQDAAAQKVLKKLKYATPKCLEVKDNAATNQTLAGWRMIQKEAQACFGSEQKNKGPMGHAFITRNPLLPEELFVPKGLDPLVLEMNKNVEHSLLDCPGKYTVQVATFKGQILIDQKEIAAIEKGEKKFDSGLAKAALQAHQLTQALRIKGYEAYEFHDRYASIVTVGSFDSVGTPLPDGRTDLNPIIARIMQVFGGMGGHVAEKPGLQAVGKSVAGIPLDLQPIPVEVPKRSLSTEINRRSQSER